MHEHSYAARRLLAGLDGDQRRSKGNSPQESLGRRRRCREGRVGLLGRHGCIGGSPVAGEHRRRARRRDGRTARTPVAGGLSAAPGQDKGAVR
jgi:hypothetical protein